MAEEEDEGGFGGLYEDGHWIWDDSVQSLVFVSDLPLKAIETIHMQTKVPTGAIEFRDDVDLIEQLRFRRRYQRKVKPGQPDVITLQDIKDIALFTAPVNILCPMLINMLHVSTTERFIRALIFGCQYYLQVSEEMAMRVLELETKVRTPFCDDLENRFRLNLCDLRVLVAKEYCTMLLGGSDTKKFHHMGPQKKRRSLSDKDARLFETFLRMCVQIVWLALGRKCFNQIELEVNRLFKSEIFNVVEHTLLTNCYNKMSKEERHVLLGGCLRKDKKLTTRSPLMNEVFCHRDMDYRIFGLGVLKFPHMSSPSAASSRSGSSMKKSVPAVQRKLYPEIILPPQGSETFFPPSFPDEADPPHVCSEEQRRRWQNRLIRLLNPQNVGISRAKTKD